MVCNDLEHKLLSVCWQGPSTRDHLYTYEHCAAFNACFKSDSQDRATTLDTLGGPMLKLLATCTHDSRIYFLATDGSEHDFYTSNIIKPKLKEASVTSPGPVENRAMASQEQRLEGNCSKIGNGTVCNLRRNSIGNFGSRRCWPIVL